MRWEYASSSRRLAANANGLREICSLSATNGLSPRLSELLLLCRYVSVVAHLKKMVHTSDSSRRAHTRRALCFVFFSQFSRAAILHDRSGSDRTAPPRLQLFQGTGPLISISAGDFSSSRWGFRMINRLGGVGGGQLWINRH